MTSRMRRDIAEIKNMLLQMSALAEEAVRTAVLASQQQDLNLAEKVIERDWEVDNLEAQIDSLVLKTMALQQPMAVDLRFLTSASKIAEQLERVGDHAVNISEQVINLVKHSDAVAVSHPGVREMASLAVKMLGESINAFVYSDTAMAYEVRVRDAEVDDLYIEVMNEAVAAMEGNRSDVRAGVYQIILALNIERIADLATNIAEDVIFLVDGRLLRHDEERESREGPAQEAGGCQPAEGRRREPLECLENHAKYVHQCFEKALHALDAYMEGNEKAFLTYQEQVSELEQAADMIKRNVRAHLPKGIIMPIDKFELFLYLNEQDAIADTSEDLLEWLTYRRPKFAPEFKSGIRTLYQKCLLISQSLSPIIHAARTYFETGDEDVRVHIKDSIRALRVHEHDADVMEHKMKGLVFSLAPQDSQCNCYLLRLVELVGEAADRAETAADIMRSMIAR